MTMTPDQLLTALNWRYAVKKFDPTKKIPQEQWHALEESLRLAPSSYGLQPWKFFLIETPALREQLRLQSWNQSQVTDCSHYVVFATRTEITETDIDRHIERMVEVRGVPRESLNGFKDGTLGDLVKGPRSAVIKWWAQRQSYIAMGFLMESAAHLGIDTCAMEGLDPAAYDRLLQLEGSGYATVAAVACGYRHADDKYQRIQKVRYSREQIFETR